jgi:hypothetical protein
MGAKDRHDALSPSELARLTGVSTDPLRHYERKGVLNRPARSDRGYRHALADRPVVDRAAARQPRTLGTATPRRRALARR